MPKKLKTKKISRPVRTKASKATYKPTKANGKRPRRIPGY